ncbi:branched-chain amino acid ABC transporter permease [Sorangium sp. So ce1078]|uniref:branched-chain amino acid ABC transporter permease n=1 Tax=Sorangium sp. So ce1078 TaxID=3133329 RepID=UPI003F60EA18
MTQLITITLNGLTRGALIFLVASGFTLVFGVMRLVNLAHGALCLLGAYAAFSIREATGSWALAVLLSPLVTVVAGLALERTLLRPTKGSDMRQALVTIGAGIIIADQLLAQYGGHSYDVTPPPEIDGSTSIAGVVYPTIRLVTMGVAVLVGAVLWLVIQRTRLGRLVRAGIDDRDMVSALGIDVDAVFLVVFALGALLAGLAGAIGGTNLSVSPGDDGTYLLSSLVVVIVGGLGSIGGAALGALLVGLIEQYGLAYFPTYSVIVTYLLMIGVLAFRPQGLLGRAG